MTDSEQRLYKWASELAAYGWYGKGKIYIDDIGRVMEHVINGMTIKEALKERP